MSVKTYVMFKIKYFIFGLLCAGLFLTSCEDTLPTDGTGGNSANAPFVDITDEFGVTLTDATYTPGTTFRVTVDATSNVAQLKAVEVSRDGFSLATDEFDNIDLADADEQNPQLLFGTDKDGVNYTYELTAPDTEGSYGYDFIVTDDDNLETISSFTITVEAPLEVVNATLELQASTTIEAPANSLVKVNVVATKGTYDIASIGVWENGSIISDLSRLRYNDVTMEANPLPLFAPDTEGFTSGVTVQTTTGTNTYTIRITDTEDNTTDVSFDIIETMSGTALQNVFNSILVSNAAGESLGALDLDNGVAVSAGGTNTVLSAEAELRDKGIDLGQPNASNWLQQVEAVNGSELRIVDLSALPDGFSFESVTSKEQVADAYNNALPVTDSPALQAGDLLAVASPQNIYIIQVVDVVVTTSDNEDYYEFAVKY